MAKQLKNGWGGKRQGAGRPNRTGLVSHGKRQKVDFKTPLHLTLRLKKGAPKLRTKHRLKEFCECVKLAKAYGLNTLHFSLSNTHIHLLVEAKNNSDLSRGMKSLTGRFGKKLGGPIFAGRFQIHILRTPLEMKRALHYILFNQARNEDVLDSADSYSTAKYFPDLSPLPDFLSPPRSALARADWRKGL